MENKKYCVYKLEYYQERYTTKEEAIKGHLQAIEFVKNFLKEE